MLQTKDADRDDARTRNTALDPAAIDIDDLDADVLAREAEIAHDEAAGAAMQSLLDRYFVEIRATNLLTAEQEIHLAQRIEAGDQEAADALAQANLRLVVSVARRHLNRGLSLEDLIAEGNIGLLQAVRKYEWRQGYRFSTYAVWWIRQAMTRAIADKSRTIRIPAHITAALTKRNKAISELTLRLGRAPTENELVDAVGDSTDMLEAAAVALQPLVSLSTPVGEDGESELSDLLPDADGELPEDAVVLRVAATETRRVMSDVLTEREQKVLHLRFGLDGETPQSLDVAGRILGVTRERVRQIELRALDKMRRPWVATRLRA